MATYYIDPVNGNNANDGGGWTKLLLANGLGAQPVAGETVTGAGGATGKVIKITGTWATAPTVYLYGRNATAFANGENITFSGGGSATNGQGTPYTDVVCSFKTNGKTFAAGDIIMVAKCAEVAQSGTATATTGSISVTGISGWTPAQYNIIRFDGDTTLYMIKAWTAGTSTITLYRPYRGTTGGGKIVNLLTIPNPGGWGKAGGDGTIASHITQYGGVNPATNLVDGFSIISSYGLGTNGNTFWDFSRFGTYNAQYPHGQTMNNVDCTFTDLFNFRDQGATESPWFIRCTITTFVSELASAGQALKTLDCIVNGIETGNSGGPGLRNSWMIDSVISNWKNAGWSGQLAFDLAVSNIKNVRFVDAVFDELAVGINNFGVGSSYNGAIGEATGLVFDNPRIATGAMITRASDSGGCFGEVALQNVNGVITDHRIYPLIGIYGLNLISPYFCREGLVYRTAAPSSRVNLLTYTGLVKQKFYIPMDAGVTKTISAYLMKNSNPITTAPTKNAAGSGYAVGDLLTVTQAGAGGAILRVATISGSGVATLTVISGGYNHAVANGLATVALTGGGNNACTVNITAVGAGYGSSNLPFMRLRWTTGTAPNLVSNVYDAVMANTDNAFVQVSKEITPSIKSVAIMELIFQSAGAGALAWFDDFGVV